MAKRKRRLKRMFISPAFELYDNFCPSVSDWDRIESAYGISLDEDVRASVIDIIDDYLIAHGIVTGAPTVRDAIYWITRLRRRLDATWEAVTNSNNSDGEDISVAVDGAKINLLGEIRHLRPGETWRMNELAELILDLRLACARTVLGLQQLEKVDGGFREGAPWEQMVRRLTELARDSGMPYQVSKGSATSRNPRPSPFVRFLCALQATVPEQYRLHSHSEEALATAVSRARRNTRDHNSQPGS